jgi:hypothetical protein
MRHYQYIYAATGDMVMHEFHHNNNIMISPWHIRFSAECILPDTVGCGEADGEVVQRQYQLLPSPNKTPHSRAIEWYGQPDRG